MRAVVEQPREKIRDAERSRGAILAAAQRLFAQHGFDGISIGEIGAAAGLSRGSPSYFFGSKAKLYDEVLATVFAARQQATADAFEPVLAWAAADEGVEGLRRALSSAAAGYMRYLIENPSFVSLIMREELADGARLREASGSSTAMSDAFAAIRRAGAGRGVRRFHVEDAVLLFVSLTFAPVSYRSTLLPALGVEIATPAGLRRQTKLAVEQMLGFLCL
jgi:TetR/AcrR family transcriptional regulator